MSYAVGIFIFIMIFDALFMIGATQLNHIQEEIEEYQEIEKKMKI